MNILLSIKMLVAALKAVALWPHIEIQVFNIVKNVFISQQRQMFILRHDHDMSNAISSSTSYKFPSFR